MCGITGFFSYENKINPKKYYEAHLKIAHRGPDDEGFISYTDNQLEFFKGNDTDRYFSKLSHINDAKESNLIIGHRRLSIIDLSYHGHQPFEFENLFLSYNGEIFNYIELREELKKEGYIFTTKTDTEVFLKAYHFWGVEAFNKFNGMWAASIYNMDDNSLVLTRDRFGIKPLYYSNDNESLYFASEVKFITEFVNVSLNQNIVNEYLDNCHLDFSEDTFYNEISELAPGSYLIYNSEKIIIKEYWTFTPNLNDDISYEKAQNNISMLFDKSIDFRMRSDVEVGSLLSGGLDSNAIVGNLNYRNNLGKNFQVFSAVFNDEKFSEKKYIDITLKKTPLLKENFIYPNPDEIKDKLDKILYFQEFPFRSLSVFSQFEIYNYIKKNTNVKVLLNGQGSDEQFAGYTYHYIYLLAQHLKDFKLLNYLKELNMYSKNRNVKKIKETINVVKLILKNDRKYLQFDSNILTSKLFSEFKYTPMREYLRYEDRNSMMASVESRLPFMDYNLIEYSFKIRNEYKIHNGENKKILRDTVKSYIPEEILNRKDKMGFVSPQEVWQKSILKDLILSKLNDIPATLQGFVKDYYDNGHNEWAKVWRIFCFYYWKKLNGL